ncbi:family 18 glycosyltransferase [Phakopsora pachyrhizi]|uniref:alpha-1,6-mannosyl-glycoprotein 6-beta-N-acetylglucosaminyltransferase n=1 Tax=Phakopsora pachyrhizi TaxID=170000 RepID=A0AAV0ATB4_PHAPC|nr:family 18 glycosyltransferase [Phakopsora pachyrhizi]KAI8450444.1 family 18 glycosyltransferase [Phakopsora pachyrhizi]CAH7671817.1 family 18 glycosyltransferase [Phakopsora pachyrhizi]
MVVGDYLSIPECLRSKQCLKTELYPTGIPDYKLFVFDGTDSSDVGHPLGRQWHLSFYPKENEGFSYLGLTIEHYCHNYSVVTSSKRYNKIYILGKKRSYLHPPAPQLYPPTMWKKLTNQTGIEFTIGTIEKSKNYLDPLKDSLFEGINDIGSQTRDEFIHQIQHHRAIIGLGWPPQPSTPLEALCVGTPFINPVWLGRRSQTDRSKWHCQHPYLAQYDPPYVYNVQDRHEDDVLEAIKMILKNPLEKPFIPEDMKTHNYLQRIENLIKRDWKSLAVKTRNKE